MAENNTNLLNELDQVGAALATKHFFYEGEVIRFGDEAGSIEVGKLGSEDMRTEVISVMNESFAAGVDLVAKRSKQSKRQYLKDQLALVTNRRGARRTRRGPTSASATKPGPKKGSKRGANVEQQEPAGAEG